MKNILLEPNRMIITGPQDRLAAEASAALLEIVETSISDRNVCNIALSGGRSPMDIYRKLFVKVPKPHIKKINLFMVDERYVPYNHPDSNFGKLSAVLSIVKTRIRLFPIPYNQDIQKDAAQYERVIRKHIPAGDNIPKLDAVVLGMGEDGHTASLFQGHPALQSEKALVVDVVDAPVPHDRISMNLPLLNTAREVLFVIEGAQKADIVKEAFSGNASSFFLPAMMVKPEEGRLRYFIDEQAYQKICNNA